MVSAIRRSVAICTYNRCKSLAITLDTLAAQTDVNWTAVEVLVIDNNCTDDTQAVARSFADRLPIRIVRECAQGLSHARNRALAEARGEWLIFTDDDVRLEPDWLAKYLAGLEAYPQTSFAGGRILPDWGGRPPRWFKGERLDLLDGVLVWYDMGAELRAFETHDPEPFGASFAVRRQTALTLGGFRPDLGMNGVSPGRGEETEFLRRARARGEKGVYVGPALCRHAVNPNRLSLAMLYRYGVASGRAHRILGNPSARGSRGKALSFLVRGLYQALKGRGDRFRQCVINIGIQRGLSDGVGPRQI